LFSPPAPPLAQGREPLRFGNRVPAHLHFRLAIGHPAIDLALRARSTKAGGLLGAPA